MRPESWLRVTSGLVLAIVFAAGVAAGVVGGRLMPPPHRPGPIDATIHELALDDRQIEQLHAIVDGHRGELGAIVRDVQPRIRAVMFAIEDELRPQLTAEQTRRLEAWRARRGPMPIVPH